MKLPNQVEIREVGPRDGLQNEAPVPTEAKVRLLDALSETGVRRIEAVSFVHPKAIPQMADADEVWAVARREPGVHYSALVPNTRGAERALAAGFREIECRQTDRRQAHPYRLQRHDAPLRDHPG